MSERTEGVAIGRPLGHSEPSRWSGSPGGSDPVRVTPTCMNNPNRNNKTMANYYATARSNYFAVKDEKAFREWAARLGLTVVELSLIHI